MKRRIISAFERLGIDPKTWIYCGSNGSKTDHNYFKKNFPNKSEPDLVNHCICGARIKENCYITSKDLNYDNIVIIGNCCYEEFIENKIIKCIICDEEHVYKATKHKYHCLKCTNNKKTWLQKQKKKFTHSKNELLQKYMNELKSIYTYDSLTLKAMIDLFNDQKLQIETNGRIEINYTKEYSKLLSEYKDSMQYHLSALNKEYIPVYIGFRLLNSIEKNNISNSIEKNNIRIWFKFCDEYSIACLYKNYIHTYTLNLRTEKPTKNSPSQKLITSHNNIIRIMGRL